MRRSLALWWLACASVLPVTCKAVAAPANGLPVGYDLPSSDRGGPALPDGLGWLERVWRRGLVLVPGKLAGGAPTVMFITNFSVRDKLHSLQGRLPLDAVVVAPAGGHTFPGREAFQAALASRPRFDCFVLSRVDARTIPTDVQYEVLRRVKEDGAGLLLLDIFDEAETLTPQFLGLQPTARGPDLLGGIPRAGLRQYECSKRTEFLTFNFWYGNPAYEPREQPRAAGDAWLAPFGKGTVVGLSTQSHWQRLYYARTLLPQVNLRRDMWVENDYAYSLAAKAILRAAGRVPAVEIREVRVPDGKGPGAEVVAGLSLPDGKAFQGRLVWQVRDTWGQVSDRGEMALDLPAAGRAEVAVRGAAPRDAGRRFVDLRLENGAGETVDWGSGFAVVDRGLAPPVIAARHPGGAPVGAPLEGEVRVEGAPAPARVRVTLVDRHWREVGLVEGPAATPLPWSFPAAGLDGPIWLVLADVLDAAGRVLSQSHLTITSPRTPETLPGFTPVMTGLSGSDPETAAWNEYLRRIGFTCNRPYATGDPVMAEAHAWNDVQLLPFFCAVTSDNWDCKQDRIADWEDPAREQELREGAAFVARQLAPFGHRGFNLTDDAAAAAELPPGPYTARRFHEWLRREYGHFEVVKEAWGWRDEFGQLGEPAGELPYEPYVTIAFHDWLKARYGSLPGVAKAWKLKPESNGFGFLHVFGAIQRDLLAELTRSGNPAPAADAARFMDEFSRLPGATPKPFGLIHHASIRKAYEARCFAPWIDAKRFGQERWVQYMLWVREGALNVNPRLSVGSDAAYYGQALSELFGLVDYVAPYYNDREVKVAVSRGRARRPGIYGACLGSYGAKPADCSGRRSQVWDILFAGGTGLYYWMFSGGEGGGINADLTLADAHGRYQCEVIEEIMAGPGELFTGCERIFDPIAILDSQTSGLCDELDKAAEPVTTQANSVVAFQAAFEDLGLNPHTITGPELAAGWLRQNGTRLLAMPGVCSLSDAEIAAVRDFAAAGGTVVADVRPGARLPNGNPRSAVALDEVFGIAYDAAAAARRVRGAIAPVPGLAGAPAVTVAEALADPRVKAATAKAAARLGDAPVLLVNRCAQGQAFLLNASFASYASGRIEGGSAWRPWYDAMRWVTESAGLRRAFTLTSNDQETPGFELSPFRNGQGYLLGVEDLGCGDHIGPRRPFRIGLPGRFQVFEVRSGRSLGATEAIAEDIPRNGHRAYFLAPYGRPDLTLRAAATRVRPGETLQLNLDLRTEGGSRCLHVVRLEARTPDGESFWPFRRVLRLPPTGPAAVALTVARNDPRGAWTFGATDVNTGTRTELSITVE